MRKAIRKIIGVILIILGLIALFTPLTPGSWLALIGIELVGIRLLIEKALFLKGERKERLIQWARKHKLERLARYIERSGSGNKDETRSRQNDNRG